MSDDFTNKPFFFSQNDINYIDSVNEELIDQIVGQYVDVYKLDVTETNSNLYGESSSKSYNQGFRVNCLILYNEPEIQHEEVGTDLNASIEMYFQRENLSP